MSMINDFWGEQGWEFSEAEPKDFKCEFCTVDAAYTIGTLRLCLPHLMKLRAEIVKMEPFPLNEGT